MNLNLDKTKHTFLSNKTFAPGNIVQLNKEQYTKLLGYPMAKSKRGMSNFTQQMVTKMETRIMMLKRIKSSYHMEKAIKCKMISMLVFPAVANYMNTTSIQKANSLIRSYIK